MVCVYLAEGTADFSQIVLRDVLVQVSDVQLEAGQGRGVAENNVPLPRVLGLLFLLIPKKGKRRKIKRKKKEKKKGKRE